MSDRVRSISPSESDSGTAAPATVTQTVVTQVETVTEPASTTPQKRPRKAATKAASASTAADDFSMPDEVGKGLQQAQDDVQSASGNPLFVTDSTDATGAGRLQIYDRNWKVCSQNVAPSTRATDDTDVTFAAVKLDEACP